MLRENLDNFSINRLIEHLRNPLYRNGYALILNSAITSGLGMVYWILAAHFYSAETIGLNSAILSMISFLASIGQFNLTNTLNRFVPGAGKDTRRLVLTAYGITFALGVVLSTIFLFGVDFWAPALGFLRETPILALSFVASVLIWSLFALQDSALVGLRQSVWVLGENSVFAVAKLVLMLWLASVLNDYGMWASWMIPIFGAVLVINGALFSRLIPNHVRATPGRSLQIGRKELAKYVSGDYLGSILWITTVDLLPLIVVERVSTTANAYFYLSWTISYSLYLVSRNMGMSLTTEAALDEKKLNLYSYQTLVQTFRLLIPLVLVMIVGTPYLLRLLGKDYAAEATLLLRLLSLAALPSVITALYISIARVQRRALPIVLTQGVLCIAVLGLSFILLDIYGIVGVGYAWLGSQTALAVVLLFTAMRPVWLSQINLQPMQKMAGRLRYVLWRAKRRSPIQQAFDLIPQVLPMISSPNGTPTTTWEQHRLLRTLNDVIVVALGPREQPPAALLKLAASDKAIAGLTRQREMVAALRQDTRLDGWRDLLPQTLHSGEAAGYAYVVEQALPGIEARTLFADEATRQRIQSAAASTITTLHTATATITRVDNEILSRRVDRPLQLIRSVTATHREADRWSAILDRLSDELHSALENRSLALGWIHGDFWPGNILVSPDGATVTGTLDWESAAQAEPPFLDILQLLISSRTLTSGQDLNIVLHALLEGDGWTEHEAALLAALQAHGGDALEMRTMIILTWLHHASANLGKADVYQKHWLWINKNIYGVLQFL
ncbi:MAG: phosphotransferase [Chloroflexi bacterium]|nr:phosphotransferase [Chloroflexota bacterium]